MRIAIICAVAMAPLWAAGCAGLPQMRVPLAAAASAPGWHAIASAEDVARLGAIDEAWTAARDTVARRDRAALARAGALLAPDAALALPALTPGSYRCRMTSLGRQPRGGAAVRTFAPFFCYVRAEAGGTLSFTKQTGTDLPGGWLHADGERRTVFLGARQRTPGNASLGYGVEPARDLAGVVERIGPMRWRLVLPWREGHAGMDVYELTPVPSDQQVDEPSAEKS